MKVSERSKAIVGILIQKLKEEECASKSSNLSETLRFTEGVGDFADRATRESFVLENIENFKRQQLKINRLQLALGRVREEDWEGICSGCDEEIPLSRIEACPESDLCVSCKELEELEEKKRG